MHRTVEPSILYFGTPVVLISSVHKDSSPNIAPMSSAWWLGWSCMIGLGAKGHTAANLLRERECVLNLPSIHQVEQVNHLARLTGSDPVPPHQQAMGYRHEKNKFGAAGLTAMPSELVKAPRIQECPVQLEGVLERTHAFGHRPEKAPAALAFEVRIVRAHIDDSLLTGEHGNRVDPDAWRPLFMSFCQFHGLGARAGHSTLAQVPQEQYRPAQHMGR